MTGSQLKERWSSQNVETNPGVTENDLKAFEPKYAVSFPSDLRDYFLTINGMAEGVSDVALIRFWPLNEVKPIPEAANDYADPSYIPDAESLFLFADYCIWSHAYAIRLSSSCDASNSIVIIGDERPTVMFNSFSELVAEYLKDPDRLLTNIDESQ